MNWWWWRGGFGSDAGEASGPFVSAVLITPMGQLFSILGGCSSYITEECKKKKEKQGVGKANLARKANLNLLIH